MNTLAPAQLAPLHQHQYEHDACGVGLVADIQGRASRYIVELALGGLVNLTHRGGVGADERTGDGAGISTQIPHAVFADTLDRLGGGDLQAGEYGVAMIFLPRDGDVAERARSVVETAFATRELEVLGWREVPVDVSVLGQIAATTLPEIAQLLVRRPAGHDAEAFERTLLLARKAAERAIERAGIADFFVVSCSARTVVYKGFCLPRDLAAFYTDLRDPGFVSAIALFHQRYSTNTLPTWAMAQPFRYLAHNGEINTVQGNRNWMVARSGQLEMPGGVTAEQLQPVVSLSGSDSLSLDNTLELLYLSGRPLAHALMMLVPEPWEQLPEMDPALRSFYDFHAGLTEQWDGPAALTFSDGVVAGATLDRNGLRPLRYAITAGGIFTAGSEAGTVKIDESEVVEKGRLGPGQMILVDTARGMVLKNAEIKAAIAAAQPYGDWLEEQRVELTAPVEPAVTSTVENPAAVQRAFGYNAEDARLIVLPMASEGKEPVWSMGDDAPLAVLSQKARPLSAYFRQRFAQVTNPPIDSLREKRVMALDSYIGPRPNLLIETLAAAELVHLRSVVLGEGQLAELATLDRGRLKAARLSTLFEATPGALEVALEALVAEAAAAVRGGASVLVLSDRGVDAIHAALPMLLAVGAIHHDLIRRGLRMATDLVCETGEVWDVHHLACLIGYGASAVHPYLALEAAGGYAGSRGYEETTAVELQRNYLKALENGLLKIASKMGISTAMGYRGAQIFEAIGLDQKLIDRCFAGTPSRLGGIDLAGIETDVLTRHTEAFAELAAKLPDPGFARFRKDGESHAFNPGVAKALQTAATSKEPSDFQAYRDLIAEHPLTAVRDLIEMQPLGEPVPIDEVEPASAIAQRFIVTAMSLGALSPEAFRTLAIGMNRMGGRSNSGEGGEDPAWYDEPGPDIAHSKIKQVASGRFGVTARYLANATELEIKMAQGSKPGEGGQLPGHKVTEFIAHIRHAVPGLSLISPPPHHDIYSIEDLAQLIYDLRQVNPRAQVGVKLVAEAGVGTIAAGVAKARADYILISGHSGGTGASPLASIKHAGCPWELGLAETQQTLVMNGLRSRVKLRTDGGLKRPEDIVMAAMFGAEEFGFGTSALVAIGCNMARQCHLNTCPTGIATQKEELRKKFSGAPEMVIHYFMLLAEGVREVLAGLGARSLDEVIGRSDLLAQRQLDGRAGLLDLSALFATPAAAAERKKSISLPHDTDTIDRRFLTAHGDAIASGQTVIEHFEVATPDRTVGATIAGEIALHHGARKLAPGTITLSLTGSAGQSFGAFATSGMRLILEGEANDYAGKGMSGGEISIFPSRQTRFESPQVLAGNTLLYGATGGELYLAGKAGERFAVRNSGATAVVEGVGDHGCEYMTGGMVAVLGSTGRNFGAGMTNGVAYVLDETGDFATRINGDSVALERIQPGDDDALELRRLLERHVRMTHSPHGTALLAKWDSALKSFWKVIPREALSKPIAEPVQTKGVAD